MNSTELPNPVDRAYAERQDAKTRSVRDEVNEISAHFYNDWSLDTIVDPTFYNGLVIGKGGKYQNFKRKGAE